VEIRHRQRYLDFIANPDSRTLIEKRSRMITAIRTFLDALGFLEVETPILQAIAGGAAARPFHTHHNALDADFKLRISLELPLKRLIVGGFPKVYEIGRVFRNEGVSTRHNPEFTLLELYEAYTDLDGMMDLVERMYEAACLAVTGSSRFTARSEGHSGAEIEVDLARRPWRRLPMLDGIEQYARVSRSELTDLGAACRACERVGVDTTRETCVGGIIEKLHERFVQPHLVEPTFVTDFPVETSPLAKRKPGEPSLTRRFEVYMATQELGNAFSEINDPIEQRRRFEDQALQRAAGNDEAHPMDEDFLAALECGMPPTGGLGVGMDRLAMVLSGAVSIREIIAFPLVRPEH
jgi:lysyl-tRNA synthetase class 2